LRKGGRVSAEISKLRQKFWNDKENGTKQIGHFIFKEMK
jgi:hypothetical protein